MEGGRGGRGGRGSVRGGGRGEPVVGVRVSPVPTANEKAAGYAPASRLSRQLQQLVWGPGLDEAREP
jgi:hypothetical protein